ncbi:LysR family transcriptional regulator [Diaphorobacter sp. HDW4B]|uniref:LysR family transcriptional regulator n=1 Tax=Diaphorobacter sp. HDW4B TaxID=2714925 RepID=UPI00140E39FC|nr:LysR family transcriptional regulator [Diaphorobacter sp. HDW4B]QIL73071.1 LysR family transcriptional regulator [Diaphorobacter sp. HDW4B]
MRNLNLDHLQTLITIADLGTFAAAAQTLHLAPPTVSLHIKELEARMDAALLVRGRRQAELTPAGEALVTEGRKLLLASDDLVELVQRRASGREGVVRVGMSAGVSTRLLPLMLETLIARSPGVEVRLEAVGSSESIKRLKAGTLDIGIVASPQPATAEIMMTPWRNDPMVALVPSSWDPPELVTAEWLAGRRWASFAPATQMHGLISAWFRQAAQKPRPFLTMSYPGALVSLAVASQSAALLPLEIIDEQRLSSDLAIRHLSPQLMRPMALACRVAQYPNPAVETVLAVISEFGN